MKKETAAWVAKAESDYGTASLVLEQGEEHVVETVCFHCQQCAEKYLKGYLEERNMEFPRDYDLISLVELCLPMGEEFENVRDDLNSLNNYAVAIRYPGALATRREAEAAFAAATRIRAFVRRKLGLPD